MKTQPILLALFALAMMGSDGDAPALQTGTAAAPKQARTTPRVRVHWPHRTLARYLDQGQIGPALKIVDLYRQWSSTCEQVHQHEMNQLDPIWRARDVVRLKLGLLENQLGTIPDELRCILSLPWECAFEPLEKMPRGRGTSGCGGGGGATLSIHRGSGGATRIIF